MEPLSASVIRVMDAMKEINIPCLVVELPQSTRTAIEAAEAIHCSVSQIVKSLIFRGKVSNQPYLILVSGSNRLDEKLLKSYLTEEIEKADAAFVRTHTGFVIGGVAPVGHSEPLATYIDQDLTQFPEIWAAAGTPNTVFRTSPEDLLLATGGKVIRVC